MKKKNNQKSNHTTQLKSKPAPPFSPTPPPVQYTPPPKRTSLKVIGFTTASLIIMAGVIYFFLGQSSTDSSYKGIKKRLNKLNVILITVDTLRADYLSCYHSNTAQTPHLDALAREGVLFERCISQTPLTLPSHTTILSGTYPLYHQVRDNGGFKVPQQLTLVSEILQKNEFTTSAFIGAYVLHSKWGINQGFHHYSDAFDLAKYRSTGEELEKPAADILTDAQQWLLNHKDKQFFSWIHLFDPHAPYKPPAPFNKKHSENPYAGEVEYVDEQLGLFFQFLKKNELYDQTLIIVTADHGEGLWEHGERSHGFFIYDSTVRVPLIIRAPFPFPKQRVKELVELVDIAPFILDALDLEIPASYQGQSLLPLLANNPDQTGKNRYTKDIAYTESFYSRLHLGCAELQGFYHKDWKYIRAPREELYNLEKDKTETANLALQNISTQEPLKRRLFKFIKDQAKNAIPVSRLALSNEERQRLASLGYISTQTGQESNLSLPDPKDKLEFINTYEDARVMMQEEKYAEVLVLTDKLLAEDRQNVDILIMRGVAFSKHGNPAEAAKMFYQVLELKPDYNDAMINLVHVLIADNQHGKAIGEAQRFLKLFPEDHTLYALLGDAYFYNQEPDQALENLLKSIELESENSLALSRIGEIYLQKNELEQAETYINKALAIYPRLQGANYLLGQVKKARGATEEAIGLYRQELEYYQDSFAAILELADLLMKKGDPESAIGYYRQAITLQPSFKLPYIMIARYYMESNQELEEAIALCKKGIGLEPMDEVTLMGYFILTNIYSRIGDSQNMEYYSREGEKIFNALEAQKKQ